MGSGMEGRRESVRESVRETKGQISGQNSGENRGESKGENRGENRGESKGQNSGQNRGENRGEDRGAGRGEKRSFPFTPSDSDFERSPFTGLTREGWLEAGRYLLTGFFEGMKGLGDPPLAKRTEFEVTYPHASSSGEARVREEKAEIFEGLCRTFLVGSLLIREDEKAEISGISLRDYYAEHILRCTARPQDPEYAGTYEQMQELSGWKDPYAPFQQTVETCALCLGLWACREQIWARYSKEERDTIASFLSGYAHAPTVPQNWRFFNLLVLAFLWREGYAIDEAVMDEHAREILAYEAGNGWYRDGQNFDYYGCWAFQAYAPLWCLWYGYEKRPGMARRFEEISREFVSTYPRFFSRRGEVNLWGRSGIYRNAATAPLGTFFLYRNALKGWRGTEEEAGDTERREKSEERGEEDSREEDSREEESWEEKRRGEPSPGWCRRICSGALLQFFCREDFLSMGVPSLGFYGQFRPMVQGYSCAGSPYWLGKAFLCLLLPKDHPFWTQREEEGCWEEASSKEKDGSKKEQDGNRKEQDGSRKGEGSVLETILDGPGLAICCHRESGETTLRTGKVVKNQEDLSSLDTYGKLCYSTAFPWEATVLPESDQRAVASQAYLLSLSGTSSQKPQVLWPNATFWAGQRQGVLYRRQFFSYTTREETHWMQAMNLADFPVANGIFRVDRPRLIRWPAQITMGAFGFPCLPEDGQEGAEVLGGVQVLRGRRKGLRGEEWAFLQLIGKDLTGRERTMALSIMGGWEGVDLQLRRGTNPQAEHSLLPYAFVQRQKRYDGSLPCLLLSLVLTREGAEPFSEEELFPLQNLEYDDDLGIGAYGTITLTFHGGRKRQVCFDGIEGRLSL